MYARWCSDLQATPANYPPTAVWKLFTAVFVNCFTSYNGVPVGVLCVSCVLCYNSVCFACRRGCCVFFLSVMPKLPRYWGPNCRNSKTNDCTATHGYFPERYWKVKADSHVASTGVPVTGLPAPRQRWRSTRLAIAVHTMLVMACKMRCCPCCF